MLFMKIKTPDQIERMRETSRVSLDYVHITCVLIKQHCFTITFSSPQFIFLNWMAILHFPFVHFRHCIMHQSYVSEI